MITATNETLPAEGGEALTSPFHADCRSGVGIGDLLMFGPAFAAFRQRFPNRPLLVHGDARAEEVYRHNPDVASVVQKTEGNLPVCCTAQMNRTVGKEGTVRLAFELLGVGDLAVGANADRRLRYTVTNEEADTALEISRALPFPTPIIGGQGGEDTETIRYTIAIQAHGLWITKRWQHTFPLMRLLAARGARVLLVGTDAGALPPSLTEFAGRGVWDLRGRFRFRKTLALLGLCDCFVGFDSGLAFGAASVGCPVVALTGSHDCSRLIGDMQIKHLSLHRPITPEMCFLRHGKSCRKESFYGNFCPLRVVGGVMGEGCDCIDTIQPEAVLSDVLRFCRARSEKKLNGGDAGVAGGKPLSALYDFDEVKLARPQRPMFKEQGAHAGNAAPNGGPCAPGGGVNTGTMAAGHPLRRRRGF